uniref:Uncharacterized protein n=1 Tax=Cannabis sativa TaxID=3483 RepID=A0A803QFV6_CANSA
MRDLSDSQRYDSGEGAFADKSKRSDSFIPTSMSKDEVPVARAHEVLLSTNEIERMVQELAEPVTLEEERIDKRLSKQTLRPASDMTFLKHAPIFNRKSKVGTATPLKRKSDVAPTPVADLSKKQQNVAQDEGKKVVINPAVKACDIMVLQDMFVSDEFKELNLLKKQNSNLQEGLKKAKLDAAAKDKEVEDLDSKENAKKASDQAVSDYIYTTLTKLPEFNFTVFGPQAVEMSNAFRTMSPIENQGLGENLFPKDAGDATAAEVVDDPNVPAA